MSKERKGQGIKQVDGKPQLNYDKQALEDVKEVMNREDLRRDLAEKFLFDKKDRELTELVLEGSFASAFDVLEYMSCIPKTSRGMQDKVVYIKAMKAELANRARDSVYDLRQRLATLVELERYEEAARLRDLMKSLKNGR